MVLPRPVDQQVTLGEPFAAETRFLQHADRADVARHHRCLHAVQAELLEGDPHRRAHRLRGVAPAVRLLCDRVAEIGVLEDAAHNRVQVHVADEPAGVEDPEGVGAARLALGLLNVDRFERRLEGVEALVPGRLPRAQELAVRAAERLQAGRVFGLQGAKLYPSCHTSPRRIGTAVPPASIPSTSTSGPPIMKSVCTEELLASAPSGRQCGNAWPYAMWQVAFSS